MMIRFTAVIQNDSSESYWGSHENTVYTLVMSSLYGDKWRPPTQGTPRYELGTTLRRTVIVDERRLGDRVARAGIVPGLFAEGGYALIQYDTEYGSVNDDVRELICEIFRLNSYLDEQIAVDIVKNPTHKGGYGRMTLQEIAQESRAYINDWFGKERDVTSKLLEGRDGNSLHYLRTKERNKRRRHETYLW